MYLIFFYVNINIGDCMLVRLGYVAISTAIDVTSSSPYTYTEYLNKCNIDKLDDVIKLRKKIAEAKTLVDRTEPFVLRGRNI